ncbi:MAG: threonine--tRNA ligase [Dehalococcoidales bacterium]|jgi:threonyl-tRNA synthetase|nr:threonine--tRNA ligase [Dehalococcoidales bacterium]MDP7286216.1 threonine--tRNA ligase [Dehalococcoidales bacterium]MDP7415822.1 threonine--tRNA ligase [Dehalococcoidales bacterium]
MAQSKEKNKEARLETMRHSASHIMAEAVLSIFPNTKFGIGPAIEDGFYYDFDLPRTLTPDDLPLIENKMKEIITANLIFNREEVTREEARQLFATQPYKLELIDELLDEKVSIYRQGSFIDLCRGPHVSATGEIKAFKLVSIAGAYWRGDEHRPMLQRIYGVAFDTLTILDGHLTRLKEAAQRDHRKLGRELDLFSIRDEFGPGLVLWHPKGAIIRRAIEDFWKDEHVKRDYEIVYTPHLARMDLWQTSGHLDFYLGYLYSPIDVEGQKYIVKPMNCLGHILIYQTKLRSYRDLPIRYAELGTVYRYERSGVLHGLSRVRGFTQDDAHIFCRLDQLEAEVIGVLDLALFMIDVFDFKNYQLLLSTRPEKYAGTPEVWEEATDTLRRALEYSKLNYEIDPGEGVFYGPKIDIKFESALGKAWQGPTIQVDFNLPPRFDVTYIGEDGQEHAVVMVHRTVLGSMERFLATLIEHYGGAFPLWLAPVQVRIIPIADRHLEYARKLEAELKDEGIRAEIDARAERMNPKIRQAQLEKIPYMLVVGDKEVATATISVRQRRREQQVIQSFADFKSHAKAAIAGKTNELE